MEYWSVGFQSITPVLQHSITPAFAKTMIAIIDYGMGNLRSVQKGFERAGFTAGVTRDVEKI
ncbi:MAG: hypothetical protein ACM37Z_10375, partial [Deltaproteobacteria bacterium]